MVGRVGHIVSFYRPKLVKQVGDQYQRKGNHQLPFHILLQQQKGKHIHKRQLGKDIGQVIGIVFCSQHKTEQQQPEGTLQGMYERPLPAIAPCKPFGKRERHGDTDDKHKKRLYQVPEIYLEPVAVIGVLVEPGNKRTSLPLFRHLVKQGRYPRYKDKHHQSPKEVYGKDSFLFLAQAGRHMVCLIRFHLFNLFFSFPALQLQDLNRGFYNRRKRCRIFCKFPSSCPSAN